LRKWSTTAQCLAFNWQNSRPQRIPWGLGGIFKDTFFFSWTWACIGQAGIQFKRGVALSHSSSPAVHRIVKANRKGKGPHSGRPLSGPPSGGFLVLFRLSNFNLCGWNSEGRPHFPEVVYNRVGAMPRASNLLRAPLLGIQRLGLTFPFP
jgi:hypothetical protein